MKKFFSLAMLIAMLGANAFALPTKAELDVKASSDHWTFKYKPQAEEHSKGLRPDMLKALRAGPRTTFVAKDTPIPAHGSVRNCMSPVEDQGQCGSCWDFSLTGTLRDTHACAGKGDPGRLSFNYLLNCANDMYGCGGGEPTAAHWMIAPQGPPAYGVDGKYVASSGSCQKMPPAASANAYHLLGDSNGVVHFKDIAYVIGVLHRSVSITVAADGPWESYSGGIYNACSTGPSGINHMVIFMEYDCESSVTGDGSSCVFSAQGDLPNGVGLTGIKNSWNTSWGEQGIMRSKWSDSKGAKCNAAGTDSLYYDVDQPALLATCALKVSPATVNVGDNVTVDLTSENAVTGTVNGKEVTIPSATFNLVAAGSGVQTVSGVVTGADGKTGLCAATYTVNVAPGPGPGPSPDNGGGFPWSWIIVAVLAVALISLGVVHFRKTTD